MVKVDSTDRSRRFQVGPKSLVTWLVRGLLMLLIGVCLLSAAASSIQAVLHLGYLALGATVFDAWGVLSIISALLSFTAIAGARFALRRRRLILALVFAVLALPAPFVIAASRCDTAEACRAMRWAALPAGAFKWQVRLRSVTDPNEAHDIAAGALVKAGSHDSPFKEKRFADHWIVSTIDQDGWPGAHAVRVDTRTARTSLVACPPEKIQCGMERPVVSDGRRVFRNDRVGVAAIFPASRPVCTSRGRDDEPRGFYAMVRAPDEPCEVLDGSRQIGAEVAQSTKNGCASVEAPALPWRPLSPETARLFGSRPTLGGQPSLACELRRDDDIQISVYASAPSRPSPGRSSGRLYEAYIVTTSAHLAEDIRAFEVYLQSARIGSPG